LEEPMEGNKEAGGPSVRLQAQRLIFKNVKGGERGKKVNAQSKSDVEREGVGMETGRRGAEM